MLISIFEQSLLAKTDFVKPENGVIGLSLPTAPSLPAQGTSGSSTVQVFHDIPGKDFNPIVIKMYELIDLAKAGQTLYLANPYYTDDQITAKLIAAHKRGVRVAVLLPMHNEKKTTAMAADAEMQKLSSAGIPVYLYPLLLHAKLLVTGDKVFVGSTNLDWLSLYHNYELNVLVEDAAFADQVRERYFRLSALDQRLQTVSEELSVGRFQPDQSPITPLKVAVEDLLTVRF